VPAPVTDNPALVSEFGPVNDVDLGRTWAPAARMSDSSGAGRANWVRWQGL
jgi:hypothetical protein